MFTNALWKTNYHTKVKQEKLSVILKALIENSIDNIDETWDIGRCKIDCRDLDPRDTMRVLNFIDTKLSDVFFSCTTREVLETDNSDDEDTPWIEMSDHNQSFEETPSYVYLSITKEEFQEQVKIFFSAAEEEPLDTMCSSKKAQHDKSVSFTL